MINRLLAGQLFLQAQKTPLITRFHQFVNQGGGGDKADLQALLAGRQAEAKGNMGFAGAGGTKGDDVLPGLDILAARQFHH